MRSGKRHIKALTLRKGARVITGVRGASCVEANLLVMATVGAAVFILKAGSDFKQIAGEVALNLALDTVLSKLPAGRIAGFALGLQSDNQYVIQRDEKFDKLLSMLPDVSSLTPADLKSTRDALKEMIENPIIIPEPPQPPPRGITLPGLHWEFNPDWLVDTHDWATLHKRFFRPTERGFCCGQRIRTGKATGRQVGEGRRRYKATG